MISSNPSQLSSQLSSAQLQQASVYTDLTGLQKIKQVSRAEQAEGGQSDQSLREVAEQFESIFVNMMMKSMRDANAVFEKGGLSDTNEAKFYRDMMDNQLAVSLTQGKGIGIADAVERQLREIQNPTVGRSFNSQMDASDLRRLAQPRQQSTQADAVETKAPTVQPLSFSSPQDFAEKLLPLAEKVAPSLGVDPSYLVAQAALESGWGQKSINHADGSNSFNLFGIKAGADWQGDVARITTTEYRDGVVQKEQANFRAYGSYEESLQDYSDFIRSNSRYQKALDVAADPQRYVEELQRAGYATDPQYAEKIYSISQRDVFTSRAERALL